MFAEKIATASLRSKLALLACSAFALSLAGCATITRENTSAVDRELADKQIVLDVFSARGFLGGSDYERYVLKNDLLLRECGSIADKAQMRKRKKSIEGDNVLGDDPNLIVRERTVEQLSAEEQAKVKRKLFTLSNTLSEREGKLPRPGSVFSLASPGIFELKGEIGEKKALVVTSVDAVAEPNSKELSESYDVFSTLRGVGPVICGQTTFYGIRRGEGPVPATATLW